MGSPRVGSNPAGSALFYFFILPTSLIVAAFASIHLVDGQYGQTWTLDEPGRTDLSFSTTVGNLFIHLRFIQFQKDIYDHH